MSNDTKKGMTTTRDERARTQFMTALMIKTNWVLEGINKHGKVTPKIERDLSRLSSYLDGAMFFAWSIDQAVPESLLAVLGWWNAVKGALEDGEDLRHPLAMLIDAGGPVGRER